MLDRLGDRGALILALSPVLVFIIIALILILGRINVNSRTAVTPITVGPSNPAPTISATTQPILAPTAQPSVLATSQPTVQPSPAPTGTPVEAPTAGLPTGAPSSPTAESSIVI